MTEGSGDPSKGPPGRLDALLSGVRFGQFASVGIAGAIVDVSMLVVLTEEFGILPELATVAGIESAILVMFAINERWTFAAHGQTGLGPLLRRLGRSHAVRAVGSTTQFLVFVAVYRVFFTPLSIAGIDLWLLVAKGLGMGAGVLLNYTFESLVTWKIHHE
jgi:putative flippase GtrA